MAKEKELNGALKSTEEYLNNMRKCFSVWYQKLEEEIMYMKEKTSNQTKFPIEKLEEWLGKLLINYNDLPFRKQTFTIEGKNPIQAILDYIQKLKSDIEEEE